MISWGMLKDVWAFRGFIFSNVKREFMSRFVNARLGALWLIIQPLSMILIYTMIFAELMKPSLPGKSSKFAYSIYLCSGLLVWMLFSDILSRSVSVFVQNAYLLKKIHFPKLCLPLVVILTSLIDFSIVMGIFLIFLAVTGNFPGVVVIGMFPPLAVLIAFSIGFGIFLGVINVFYRDVEKAINVIMQFWFWLTPIVYVNFPEPLEIFLKLNPVWPIIDAMHQVFVYGSFPKWDAIFYPLMLSVLMVFLGMFSFWKLQGEIVDEL